MEKVTVLLRYNPEENVTNPLEAKILAKSILSIPGNLCSVNIADYFLLKYLELLGKGDVVFIYEGKEYKSVSEIPVFVEEVLKVFEDLYTLEYK